MADATSSNFGQSNLEYGETRMSVGGVPVNPKTAGTFRVSNVLKSPSFDTLARLGSGGKLRVSVDGIKRKDGPRPLTKEEEIRLTTRIDFLIKKAEELLALRSDLDNEDGKKQLEESFGEIIAELAEMKAAITSSTLDQETLDQVKEALEERELDIDTHQHAHRLTIQSLAGMAKDEGTEAVVAKAELEKASYVAELRVRYEKLAKDVERIKNSPFSFLGKDQLVGEFESFSFLTTEKSPSLDDLQLATFRMPELENLVGVAMVELQELERSAQRQKRHLERMAGVSIATFENKKLEAVSLLQNSATGVEKDDTERLIKAIEKLSAALDSEDVTEEKVERLNQETSLLVVKIEELKALVAGGTNEKMTELRKLEQLIADFDNKKSLAFSMLSHPAAITEKASLTSLIDATDSLRTSLTRSNDVDNVEVEAFSKKISELGSAIDTLQNLIDTENKRQESMMSLHASWPKEIKYVEAKKSNNPNAPGVRGGWKKDGIPLKEQVVWGKLNDQAKRVFDRYNTLVDKALILGDGNEIKHLTVIKELVINALYQEKTDVAQVELTRLEKGVEAARSEIENSVEEKELATKFATTVSHLGRLTNIAELEKKLLEAKKGEVEKISNKLKESGNSDDTKRKELLGEYRALLGELVSAVEEKDKEAKKEEAARISEFKQLSRRLEETKTVITYKLPKGISDEDKDGLLKKLEDIETKAGDFSQHEVGKKYDKAREALFLFRSSLDSLTTSVQEKITAAKAFEPKPDETKNFGQSVAFFEKLKGEINNLDNRSDKEKEGFDRLIAELDDLRTSRAAETDKQSAGHKELLFRSLLGELASFVIKKIGYEETIKAQIESLHKQLDVAVSESRKEQILEKIKERQGALEKIKALKAEKETVVPTKRVERTPKDDSLIFLREKDPNTGKAIEMKVSEWKELQTTKNTDASIEKIDSRLRAEEDLRAIHKGMWVRDPEGYKRLYAGRKWSTGDRDQLTQKIVGEILGKAVALVDERLTSHQKELDRRNALVRSLSSGVITPEEKNELAELERTLGTWIKEKESLTVRPFDEQLMELRKKAAKESELRNQTQFYSPSDDRGMDHIPVKGVAGEEFRKKGLFNKLFGGKNSEAQQRYQIAVESAGSSKRDTIKGFTKTAVNTTPLMGKMPDPITKADFVDIDPTRKDLGVDMNKLANAVYNEKVNLGTSDAAINVAGMARSITGAPTQARAPLTPEEQERKITRTSNLMAILSKNLKGWRGWMVAAALAAGAGGTTLAFAQADLTRPVTTIEQNLSWKDFLGGLGDNERISLEAIIRDLLSK